MRLGGCVLCLLVLSACSSRPSEVSSPVQTGPVGAADTCGSAPYRYLIGEDATALERVLILRAVRVNWPEDALDGSSRPERLNFTVAGNGKIIGLSCG